MPCQRVHFRLYPELQDDAVVIEWLNSLPAGDNGKRPLKPYIVAALAKEARKQLRNSDNPSPAPIGSVRQSAVPAELAFEKPPEPEPASNSSTAEPEIPNYGA